MKLGKRFKCKFCDKVYIEGCANMAFDHLRLKHPRKITNFLNSVFKEAEHKLNFKIVEFEWVYVKNPSPFLTPIQSSTNGKKKQ